MPNREVGKLAPKRLNSLNFAFSVEFMSRTPQNTFKVFIMALLQERKLEIFSEYQKHPTDTGSSDVQVALLTERVTQLTTHLKLHPKEFSSRRSLLKIIGQRKRLLAYVRNQDRAHYKQLIQSLGVRG